MFLAVNSSLLFSVRFLRFFALALLSAILAVSNSAWAQSSVTGLNTMSGALPIGAGGGIAMTVLSSGNVGIGTTTPIQKLVVSNGGAEGIEFNPIREGANTFAMFATNRSTGNPVDLYFGANAFHFDTPIDSNERLTITSTGNVGIGIITPSAELQLYNATRGGDFGLGQQNDATPYMRLGMDTSWVQYVANNAYWTGTAYNYVEAAGYAGLATRMAQQSGNIWFDTANGGTNPISWNTRMYITNGGEVGIGMTPTALLDVNGGMRGSNSGTVAGGGCSPEGMLAYDMTNHQPIYCSSGAVWTNVNSTSGFMGRTWHCVSDGFAVNGTVWGPSTNSYGYPIEIAGYNGQCSSSITVNINATPMLKCANNEGQQDWCSYDITVPVNATFQVVASSACGGYYCALY